MRLLSASVCLFVPLVSAQSGETLFAIPSTAEEWDFCGLDYTELCPPTISIEQAACEASLIVNGRVLQTVNGETREDTVVQIQVDYRSEFFGSIDRKTIQKWGAGLNNTDDTSVFANSSGFFTTWVTAGFNNTPTDFAPVGVGSTPCGTSSPQSQETMFFFLQALPENEGKKVEILQDGTLNVNFSLSTTVLQTGVVEDTEESFDLVSAGAFSDDNHLKGNCEVVYCCYNPACDRCPSILQEVEAEFTCDSTYAPESAASMLTWSLSLVVSTLLIFKVGY